MIVLRQYATGLGLPNPSPFCMKAEILLKMSGLPFEVETVNDPRKGPKGKLPAAGFDGGEMLGDSELILQEMARRHGFDPDARLDARQRAQSHAIARMLEERLYWAIVHGRWMHQPTYDRIAKDLFGSMPPVIRSIIKVVARRRVRANLAGHGLGLHDAATIAAFGAADIAACATLLGDQEWLMGPEPTSVDATGVAFMANVLVPDIPNPLKDALKQHPNLVAYAERGRQRWYPDYPAWG
ncbi:MAG: glutathione S-transferase family protein [Minwuia sp.]|nr:glutathione S-transferase family protein [Minwuia sp.]